MRTPRSWSSPAAGESIDLTPLIDVVFILLLFFLVTSTFDRDRGVAIEKAATTQRDTLDRKNVRILITARGDRYIAGQVVGRTKLEQHLREAQQGRPELAVTIVPDRETRAAVLLETMDWIKALGIRAIAVATARAEEPSP